MPEIDMAFPHSYEVEEVGEFPSSGKFGIPQVFIPPPKGRPEHNGLWLKVKPSNGADWIGVFAIGYPSSRAFSRVVSTPDSSRLCAISQSAAYIVTADNPEQWESVPLLPVLDVRAIPRENLLVFSDFTNLGAYGPGGFAWRSPRVCWDDLKIVNITHDTIEGTGYDPTNRITHESRFVVDLKTGRSLLPAPVSTTGKPIW